MRIALHLVSSCLSSSFFCRRRRRRTRLLTVDAASSRLTQVMEPCRGAKEKNTTLLGGAECKKAVDYRYIMVDRTCDTLSDDRLLPQPDFYRNGKTIRRIVFPATVNSRHSALHSHGFTELCTAFAVHKTNNHPVWSGCLFVFR